MKILTVADVPSKALWDYFDPKRLADIDLILSAGDLPPAYLSFLVTFAHCPLLYVHGNHDDCYQKTPPEGCICIDDTLYQFEGLQILGLGGSMRYRPGTFQYTDREMNRRVRRLAFRLWRRHGFDILLTHAPGRGIDDQEDLPHRGFEAFPRLLKAYSPAYMVHGHVHLNYGHGIPRRMQYGNTTVINAYERQVIEFP